MLSLDFLDLRIEQHLNFVLISVGGEHLIGRNPLERDFANLSGAEMFGSRSRRGCGGQFAVAKLDCFYVEIGVVIVVKNRREAGPPAWLGIPVAAILEARDSNHMFVLDL